MNIFEIILTSFALASDAFAVSICKGIVIKNERLKKSVLIAIYFGFFQGLMTLIGYLFGSLFYDLIVNFDHWIAFIFLLIIGINMIGESFKQNNISDNIRFSEMLFLSIATSIDALVIGITLSLFNLNIIISILLITLITFLLSLIGVLFGNILNDKLNIKMVIVGGILLIILGIKILFEHLQIL